MDKKIKILYLCTGNSCRSQMAEGWTRALKNDQIDVYSAGIMSKSLDPKAVKVMKEAGVDISSYKSKNVLDFLKQKIEFDYVITLCGHANETCPIFPAKTKHIHAGFDDPPKLAEFAKTEEEALNYYRQIRDEIMTFIESLPESLYKNK